jgi:hypothetical protein
MRRKMSTASRFSFNFWRRCDFGRATDSALPTNSNQLMRKLDRSKRSIGWLPKISAGFPISGSLMKEGSHRTLAIVGIVNGSGLTGLQRCTRAIVGIGERRAADVRIAGTSPLNHQLTASRKCGAGSTKIKSRNRSIKARANRSTPHSVLLRAISASRTRVVRRRVGVSEPVPCVLWMIRTHVIPNGASRNRGGGQGVDRF